MKLGALLKWGILIKEVSFFEMVAEEICNEMFIQWIREAESSYENLMKLPKFH